MKDFSESEALAVMRAALPSEAAERYSDDDLTEVLDLIFDYYDESGQLEIDASDNADDDDLDEDAELDNTCAFVTKFIKKDRQSAIRAEDIPALVRAEYQYELSLI